MALALAAIVTAPAASRAQSPIDVCKASDHSTVVCAGVTVNIGDPKLSAHIDRIAKQLNAVTSNAVQNNKSVQAELKRVEADMSLHAEKFEKVFAALDGLDQVNASLGAFSAEQTELRNTVSAVLDQLFLFGSVLVDQDQRISGLEDQVRRLQEDRTGPLCYSNERHALVIGGALQHSIPLTDRVGTLGPENAWVGTVQLRYRFSTRWLVGGGVDMFFAQRDDRAEFTSGEPGSPVLDTASVSSSTDGLGLHVAGLWEAPLDVTWLAFELRAGVTFTTESWSGANVRKVTRSDSSYPMQVLAHMRIVEGLAVTASTGLLVSPKAQPLALAYSLDGSTVTPYPTRAETRWFAGGGLEYAFSL